MSFNPSAPTLIGPEWPATREGIQRIDSIYNVATPVFTSSTTETIDAIGFWLTTFQLPINTAWEVEIYNTAALDSGAPGSTTYNPDTDKAISSSISNNAGSGTMWDKVDEGLVSPNAADWIQGGLGAPFPTVAGFQFASIAGSLTGKVITGVKLACWCALATGFVGDPSPMNLAPFLTLDGQGYFGPVQAIDTNLHYIEQNWPVNPATQVSWKIADVEKFDTDTDSYAGYYFAPTNSVNWAIRIFSMALIVTWGTTERRVAVGKLGSVGNFTRTLAFLQTPTGTDNWAKTSGLQYLVLLRRTWGNGSIGARWLDSGAACPHAGHKAAAVSFLSDGRLDPAGTNVNAFTRAYDLAMSTTGFTGSPDSQPYGSVNGDHGPGEVFYGANNTLNYGFVTHEQEFTPGASANYQSIQVLIRGTSNLLPPDYDLQIKIKRRSDNVQLGGTLVIAAGQLTPPYNTWRIIRGNITPAALVSGTQYYFEISSTSASSTSARSWQIQVLSGMEANNAYDQYNFGGQGNCMTWFATDAVYADVHVSIAQAVTNVTGFAAAAQSLALTSPSGWSMSITTMQKIHLSWTKTSLGASFMRYEIDRFNTWTSLWENIARITNENTQAFDDLECRVGVLGSYRIRTVHVNGAASDWSTTATATPAWGSYAAGLLFVSNEAPTLACGFLTDGPDVEYTFLNATTIEAKQFQGRNFQVAFRDMEERGLSFERLVYINAEVVPARKGEPMFQALRDMADAPTSYVAVKNRDGEVWYASLAVDSGIRGEPGNFYQAKVTVLQTTDIPSIVSA